LMGFFFRFEGVVVEAFPFSDNTVGFLSCS